jgi:hypothetical protein
MNEHVLIPVWLLGCKLMPIRQEELNITHSIYCGFVCQAKGGSVGNFPKRLAFKSEKNGVPPLTQGRGLVTGGNKEAPLAARWQMIFSVGTQWEQQP